MKNLKLTNDVELAPLRSLDDFLLRSARFQIPNLKDPEKWGNRMVYNLLYYQTNYMFMFSVIFLIVGLLHPVKMLVGTLAFVVSFAFIYVSIEGSVYNFKKRYPAVGIVFIILAGCFLTYTLGSLIVFFLGILLPICVTFVHASLRLRNMKNRIVNKMEAIGFKRTPMGIMLEHLGKLAEILYIIHVIIHFLVDMLMDSIAINQEKDSNVLER